MTVSPMARPVGGKWKAPEGWEAAHTGWQVNSGSEFGVAERWPVVGDGTKGESSPIPHIANTRAPRTPVLLA